MARRIDYDFIFNFFKENNCELLEKEYKNNSTNMMFKCHCGNLDYKSYQTFKSAPRCRECSSKNSLKQLKTKRNIFKDVVNFVAENSSCTLLSTEYINNSTPLTFRCECGENFDTSYAKFKDRNKRQCNNCSKNASKNKLKTSFEDVKSYVEENSDCILLSNEYINNATELNFLCSCGEHFATTYAKFKDRMQRQCYDCGQKIKNKPFDIEIVRSTIESEGCFLLSNEYKNARTPLSIRCECSSIFPTTLEIFKRGKNRCDYCSSRQSKLSRKVEDFLNMYNVKYLKEYRFEDCRNVYPLPFDFALLDEDGSLLSLVEVDGRQHFEPLELFGGEESFKEQQKRDKIKNDYCKENGLSLIRIPYYEENNIEDILKKHLLA